MLGEGWWLRRAGGGPPATSQGISVGGLRRGRRRSESGDDGSLALAARQEAGDVGGEELAEVGEFAVAYASDGAEEVWGGGLEAGHVSEDGVVEDEVGGDAALAGEAEAEGGEGVEEGGVGGREWGRGGGGRRSRRGRGRSPLRPPAAATSPFGGGAAASAGGLEERDFLLAFEDGD